VSHNEVLGLVSNSYEHITKAAKLQAEGMEQFSIIANKTRLAFQKEISSFKTSVNNSLENKGRENTKRIDKISKQVAQNSQISIPSGAVIAWYPRNHSSVPDGWALCNGDNSTPNLEEKFVTLPDPSYNLLNDTYLEVFIMKLQI
jgi:hypothetical protein